jgi:hypothetical protein
MVETIAGVTSIRAFGLQNQFLQQFQGKVDGMNNAYYSLMVSTQWYIKQPKIMSIRMN